MLQNQKRITRNQRINRSYCGSAAAAVIPKDQESVVAEICRLRSVDVFRSKRGATEHDHCSAAEKHNRCSCRCREPLLCAEQLNSAENRDGRGLELLPCATLSLGELLRDITAAEVQNK